MILSGCWHQFPGTCFHLLVSTAPPQFANLPTVMYGSRGDPYVTAVCNLRICSIMICSPICKLMRRALHHLEQNNLELVCRNSPIPVLWANKRPISPNSVDLGRMMSQRGQWSQPRDPKSNPIMEIGTTRNPFGSGQPIEYCKRSLLVVFV